MPGLHAVAAAPVAGTGSFLSGLAMTISAAVTTAASRIREVSSVIPVAVSATVDRIRDVTLFRDTTVGIAAQFAINAVKEIIGTLTVGSDYLREVTMSFLYGTMVQGFSIVETQFEKMIVALAYTSANASRLFNKAAISAYATVAPAMNRVWSIPKTVIVHVTPVAERYRAVFYTAVVSTSAVLVSKLRHLLASFQASATVAGSAVKDVLFRYINALAWVVTDASVTKYRILHYALEATQQVVATYQAIRSLLRTVTATVVVAGQRLGDSLREPIVVVATVMATASHETIKHLLRTISATTSFVVDVARITYRNPQVLVAYVTTSVSMESWRKLTASFVATVTTAASYTYHNTLTYATYVATVTTSATISTVYSFIRIVEAAVTVTADRAASFFRIVVATASTSVDIARHFTMERVASLVAAFNYLRSFFLNEMVAGASTSHMFTHHKGTPITTISSRRMTVEADSRSAAATSEDRRMAVYGEDRNMNV